jgi:hypothetical protein
MVLAIPVKAETVALRHSKITPSVGGSFSIVKKQTINISKLRNRIATKLAIAMKKARKRHWGPVKEYPKLAKLFVKYGKRWKIDPILVAAVAYTESRYQLRPKMYAKRCQWKGNYCNKPGPCYKFNWKYTKICKTVLVNKDESGMMQVLYYDKSTRQGYYKCTGKRLTGTRKQRREKLSPVDVSICVGTYELAKWKKWTYYGGWGTIKCRKRGMRTKYCPLRLKPRKEKNIKFFTKYPRLKRHFWISFYNWGSNRWKGNFYPRFVLWMYMKYKRIIGNIKGGNDEFGKQLARKNRQKRQNKDLKRLPKVQATSTSSGGKN